METQAETPATLPDSILSRNWWTLLLRGLCAIAFGALLWTRPGISLATLILFFGVFALADGILGVITAVSAHKDDDDWWVLLIRGMLGIGIGTLTFFAPGITAVALLFYIALWSISTGVMEIVAAIRLRKEIEGEWLLALSGLASVIFGNFLIARPGAGALAVVWVIACYAAVMGLLLVILSFRVRTFAKAN